MKVFTHGSNLNFQTSAREVYATDLHMLLAPYQPAKQPVLVGAISLDKEEIYLYGYGKQMTVQPDDNWCVSYRLPEENSERSLVHPVEEIVLTQEAQFDVIEKGETIRYQVFYLTFRDGEEEITYFLAPSDTVEQPLAYVAEFYRHTADIGRDVDFAISGCHAYDFNRLLRERRNQ